MSGDEEKKALGELLIDDEQADVIDIAYAVKGLVGFTKNGEIMLLPKARALPVKDQVFLAILGAHLAYKYGVRNSNIITTKELQNIVGGQENSVRARVTELIKKDKTVKSTGRGMYQIMVLPARQYILTKLGVAQDE